METCSSDEMSDQLKDNQITVDLFTIISGIKLLRKELYFYILSTFLGLAQNDIMSRDCGIYISFIDVCLNFMSSPMSKLTSSHCYGLVKVIAALLFDLSGNKDGLMKVTASTFYADLFNICQIFMHDQSQSVYVFLCLNTYASVLSCLLQSFACVASSPSSYTDISKLLTKFIQLNYFELLIDIITKFDLIYVHIEDLNISSDIYTKQIVQFIELIIKQLMRLCKSVRGMKDRCEECSLNRQHKEHISIRTRLVFQKRRSKSYTKFDSSDEERFRKGGKSSSELDVVSEGESACENVSDFNSMFSKSSGSETDKKTYARDVKAKQDLIMSKPGNYLS